MRKSQRASRLEIGCVHSRMRFECGRGQQLARAAPTPKQAPGGLRVSLTPVSPHMGPMGDARESAHPTFRLAFALKEKQVAHDSRQRRVSKRRLARLQLCSLICRNALCRSATHTATAARCTLRCCAAPSGDARSAYKAKKDAVRTRRAARGADRRQH